MFQSFKQILPVSLVLSGFAVATPNELVERQSSSTCAPLHLMIAGGCQIPCSYDAAGLLGTLVANITAAHPGADQYIVPYTNATQQAQVSTPFMVAAANAYSVSCPNTPIVFVGYSLGGIVVMNTLCGGISANPNVIAAIVYGEETYTYPQSWDVGTCTNNAPLYPRAAARVAACAPFASAIQSYCDAADPQCCTGGTNSDAHFAYPGIYDLPALAFVNTKFAAFKANQTSLSSSSSMASSTSTSTSSSSSSSLVVPITSATSTSAAPTTTISITSTTVASTSASSTSPVSSTSSASSSTTAPAPISSSSIVISPVPLPSPISVSISASSSAMVVSPVPLPSPLSVSLPTSSSTSTRTIVSTPSASASASASTVSAATSTTTRTITSASSASALSSTMATAPKVSATVAPYTGAASSLSVPGFAQSLCKVWKGVASFVAM